VTNPKPSSVVNAVINVEDFLFVLPSQPSQLNFPFTKRYFVAKSAGDWYIAIANSFAIAWWTPRQDIERKETDCFFGTCLIASSVLHRPSLYHVKSCYSTAKNNKLMQAFAFANRHPINSRPPPELIKTPCVSDIILNTSYTGRESAVGKSVLLTTGHKQVIQSAKMVHFSKANEK